MSERDPARSATAAEASRLNGSKSRGPRTAKGKANSARNSVKHGLFSASICAGRAMPASAAALATELESISQGGTVHAGLAISAEAGLATATAIIHATDLRISALLADIGRNEDELASLVLERARIGRYQRRFRGQRDQALRRVMCTTSSSGAGAQDADMADQATVLTAP